jgi:succinate dehydrogenase / fumarate reductase cytochrome b subunit
MIGPYYRPQLSSVLSITHRGTGVFLSMVSLPLLLWWLIALASGPEQFAQINGVLGGLPGRLVVLASIFCLNFHMFNGIRHLVWDMGYFLDMKAANASGIAVLVAAVLLTGLLAGGVL